jgi:hypothetical protein
LFPALALSEDGNFGLDEPIALDGNSLSVYIARDGQINP